MIKIMDKYAQLNMFHYDHRLQVYIYDFIYVDPETMPAEDHFPATKKIVLRYKKISTPGTVPKHWLVFSYIFSEDYELYQNFDDTELK